MTIVDQQIVRNIAEFKRLCRLTTYQRINERASARKSERWQSYVPLHAAQLQDDDDDDLLTVAAFSVDHDHPAGQSTMRTSQSLKLFVVIHRPCERRALNHITGCWQYDDELPPLIVRRPAQKRWCIWCRDRHPVRAFVRHDRYLNGLSYACADAIQRRKRLRWRLIA